MMTSVFSPTEPAGLPADLPEHPPQDGSVPHAPIRVPRLSEEDFQLAIRNALRYFPEHLHAKLALEFAHEMKKLGHVYMHRYRPLYEMKARPITEYKAKCAAGAAIMLMIQNNLDPRVAQFPHELITYGGNGSVFQNWAQYHLTMKYLSELTEEQTLVLMSGHPLGLFPSSRDSPRMILTNGLMVPCFATREMYDQLYALGCTQYGQMTAGSFCYIGPQGIVHGTTITVLNAGRKYLGSADLAGKVFVTSGLGGMSGAQAKAAVIAGAIGVVAEINPAALHKRHQQGWVQEWLDDLDRVVERIRRARAERRPLSLAYLGNVVDLWERLAREPDALVELGSDQTSLHNPYGGGYYPVQLSFDEANRMMHADPTRFRELVQESLRRQVAAINTLTARGMRFWDYGNAFLLEASRAQADVMAKDGKGFRYPSYVQDIMGDIFSLGFGPFRWVCTSGDPADLRETDRIAERVMSELLAGSDARARQQYEDNLNWIRQAEAHRLVVGSQARILYTDRRGRVAIARAFHEAVASGRVRAPIVCSRDHHDVSGADSPYRETSNITDGSMYCADMATLTALGNAARGATWVALHNGGGTGWGMAINCGFGCVARAQRGAGCGALLTGRRISLLIDATPESAERAAIMLAWDVDSGVARRAWGRNENARWAAEQAMRDEPRLRITLPAIADPATVAAAVQQALRE